MVMRNDRAVEAIERLADRVVEAIEQSIDLGTWKMPWRTPGFLSGAVNVATGRQYTGSNLFNLAFSELLDGAVSPWGTYKQWASVGGQVRKGEHGTAILAPRTFDRVEYEDGKEVVVTKLFFRTFIVFHAGQQDGWEWQVEDRNEGQPIEECEQFVEQLRLASDPLVTVDAPYAFYNQGADKVGIPPFASFDDPEGYYGTLFHEITHWTKHPRRCDRAFEYAEEELVAEFGSALLCHAFGIPVTERPDHAQYLKAWAERLKGDKMFVQTAVHEAQRGWAWLQDHVETVKVAA